jgi:hypothetical protein
METMPSLEVLDSPDIEVGGLKIWVHGRQYPEAFDYNDGNWLSITALCISKGAQVWTSGHIINLPELENWLIDLERINKEFTGEANLQCTESELRVKLSINKLGQIKMIVNITPDILIQMHQFEINLDQSYLPALINNLRKVLCSYSIRSPRKKT